MSSSFVHRNLRQDVTYWAPSGVAGSTNDFGHPIVSAGVVLKGRWEDRVQQIRKGNGEEVTSMATVYLPQAVDIHGFLKLGGFPGEPWTDHQDAQEVQDVRTVPDLRNLAQETRAYL